MNLMVNLTSVGSNIEFKAKLSDGFNFSLGLVLNSVFKFQSNILIQVLLFFCLNLWVCEGTIW